MGNNPKIRIPKSRPVNRPRPSPESATLELHEVRSDTRPSRQFITPDMLGLGDVRALRDGRVSIDYTQRDGWPGMPWSWGTLVLEHLPELQPLEARGRGGNPGIFWKIRHLPQVYAALSRPIRALVSTPWRVDRPTLPDWVTPEEVAAAEVQFEFCQRLFHQWREEEGGFERFVRDVLWTAPVCGFAWFELVAHERPTLFSDGVIRNALFPRLPEWRAPWSVTWWITKREQLVGVIADYWHSNDYSGEHGPSNVLIPAEKILHIASEQVGTNYEGVSWLRSIYNHLLMLQQTYQLQALAVEVNAVGELWFKLPDEFNDDEGEQELEDYVKTRKAEHAPGGVLPNGVEPQYGSPKNTMPDLSPVLEDLTKAIALGLDNEDRLIALQQAGSWAAKTTASEDAQMQYDYIGQTYIQRPIESVFRRFLKLNFPEWARRHMIFTPRLAYGHPEERDPKAFLESVVLGHQSGVLHDPELGPPLREMMDLPPMSEDTSEGVPLAHPMADNPQGGEWLSTRVLADRFGLSVSTVAKWMRNGSIRARKIGSQWRASATDVELFLATDDELTGPNRASESEPDADPNTPVADLAEEDY